MDIISSSGFSLILLRESGRRRRLKIDYFIQWLACLQRYLGLVALRDARLLYNSRPMLYSYCVSSWLASQGRRSAREVRDVRDYGAARVPGGQRQAGTHVFLSADM